MLPKTTKKSKRKKIFKIIKIILITLAIIICGIAITILILSPKPQKNINYGVTFSKKYSEQMGMDWRSTYLKILDELGVKNLRLVAYWDDIERTPNQYDFSDIKWQLDEAEKRNLNIIMTIGRKVPRYPECFEPTWWKQIEDTGTRDEILYNYIEIAVKELKPYNAIKMWQVENEPYFDFGECLKISNKTVENEVTIVKSLDNRPLLTQDSGEGGVWRQSYELGDYLGISMYRKVWFDFWKIIKGFYVYYEYPLGYWSYKIKANLLGIPVDKIIVTELQAEPWGPAINSKLTRKEVEETMSKEQFITTIEYAQKSGFKDIYFWGPEWWLFEKEQRDMPFYWETAKEYFK